MKRLEVLTVGSREFRSPARGLLKFFVGSRDGWKKKCMEARSSRKLMANQVRAVERSRANWRSRAEHAEERVSELERELADLKRG